tara:strand:- start:67 stop:510 length:444 start_codon:yes stop_codon:yes gene_type:complete
MRRSASEIIRNLEMRIARLEKQSVKDHTVITSNFAHNFFNCVFEAAQEWSYKTKMIKKSFVSEINYGSRKINLIFTTGKAGGAYNSHMEWNNEIEMARYLKEIGNEALDGLLLSFKEVYRKYSSGIEGLAVGYIMQSMIELIEDILV